MVDNLVLYAAPVWGHAMNLERCKMIVGRIQQTALLRVASAYRTVSAEALNVITGTPPMHLLILERKRLRV